MLEDKMKERDGSYRCHIQENKTSDMMDHIGQSMLEDKMKECD